MLAWMIGIYQDGDGGVGGIVSKRISRTANDTVLVFEDSQVVVVRQLAQRDDYLDPVEQLKLAFQISPARADFIDGRFIVRWRAVARRGNVRISKFEPIASMPTGWLGCKARLVKDPVQEIAAAIACEHAAGAVRAMGSRCKSEDEKPCVRVA